MYGVSRMGLPAWLGLVASAGLMTAHAAGRPNGHANTPDVVGGYASTHIIVRLAPGAVILPETDRNPVRATKQPSGRRPVDVSLPATLGPAFQTLCAEWGVIGGRRAYTRQFGRPDVASRIGLDRTYILEVPMGTDTAAMAADFSALEDQIEFAEVDGIGGVAQFIPDDEYFERQYAMHNTGQVVNYRTGCPDADIDAPEAWKIHTGEVGTVTVAVVDSGVSPHAEFGDRLLPGHNTDDPSAPDRTIDECPHGTHVAGIIAAEGNNGIGVAGVTWGANILPVRVLGHPSPCSGYESAAADGIIWATDHGADTINMSLQYCTGTQEFEDAVDYAHSQGVLVVSAAGNDDFQCAPGVVAPARFANSMAVSATTSCDLIAGFSRFGNEIDVCAPGEMIWSTWISNWYNFRSGTSMATPHVSGLAALLKSYVPALTHTDIRDILTRTADDLGPTGWDDQYGYGRINAYQALLDAGPLRIMGSVPPDGAIDARQPSEPDGTNPAGWDSVELTFSRDASGLTTGDFAITQAGGVAETPTVQALEPIGEAAVRVILSDTLAVGAWTTVTHTDSGTAVRLGVLPGDASGDGVSSSPDIFVLIDALNEAIDPLPAWSTDIDRSGELGPADILREIDLLSGADLYEPFDDRQLPSPP